MRLGLGISLGPRNSGASAPAEPASPLASLFAASEAGALYDLTLPSMFQDSAGTTPAVVDQPVGRVNDKSGRGNHALQATAGFRPILRQDGANYYLEFDGTDDWLRATFTVAQPWDRISAIRQISWTSGDRIFGGATANAGVVFQNTATPGISSFDGSIQAINNDLAVGANGILTERHNGASSRTAVNNGTYTTGTTGVILPGGMTIAANNSGGLQSNIRYYGGLMINRALTDPEIDTVRAYFAGKSGVTL